MANHTFSHKFQRITCSLRSLIQYSNGGRTQKCGHKAYPEFRPVAKPGVSQPKVTQLECSEQTKRWGAPFQLCPAPSVTHHTLPAILGSMNGHEMLSRHPQVAITPSAHQMAPWSPAKMEFPNISQSMAKVLQCSSLLPLANIDNCWLAGARRWEAIATILTVNGWPRG